MSEMTDLIPSPLSTVRAAALVHFLGRGYRVAAYERSTGATAVWAMSGSASLVLTLEPDPHGTRVHVSVHGDWPAVEGFSSPPLISPQVQRANLALLVSQIAAKAHLHRHD
jgi:hypothetical protein